MKLGCLLLGVGLLACSGEEAADPLASANGFCEEWAKRACSDAVLARCGADDKVTCRESQAEFCERLVPNTLYSKDAAQECLDAVEEAYKDAELKSEERDVVRSLAAPCDLILSGNGQTDDSCDESSDCDRVGGYDCVVPLGVTQGTCQKPNRKRGGSSCDGEADVCEDGYYCDDEYNCLERQNAGELCSDAVPCAEGLNCELEPDAGAGICRAKMLRGEDGCEVDSDCATDICQSANNRSICSSEIILSQLEPICDDLR
jgi:hypothetical protein